MTPFWHTVTVEWIRILPNVTLCLSKPIIVRDGDFVERLDYNTSGRCEHFTHLGVDEHNGNSNIVAALSHCHNGKFIRGFVSTKDFSFDIATASPRKTTLQGFFWHQRVLICLECLFRDENMRWRKFLLLLMLLELREAERNNSPTIYEFFRQILLGFSENILRAAIFTSAEISCIVLLFRWRYKIRCVSWFNDGRSQSPLVYILLCLKKKSL